MKKPLIIPQAKVITDLTSYEASLDSNKTAFMDIQEEIGVIAKLLDAPRINREKISDAVENISKIIRN